MNFSLFEFIGFMVRVLAEFSRKYHGSGGKTIPEWIETLMKYMEDNNNV